MEQFLVLVADRPEATLAIINWNQRVRSAKLSLITSCANIAKALCTTQCSSFGKLEFQALLDLYLRTESRVLS